MTDSEDTEPANSKTVAIVHGTPTNRDMPAIADILGAVGWGDQADYQTDQLHAMFDGTDYVAVAKTDERTVGYIRAFTDYVSVAWIAEIAVHPDFQRQGVGKRLLDEVVRDLSKTAIYAEVTPGTEAFFARNGLKTRPQDLTAVSRAPARPQTLNVQAG